MNNVQSSSPDIQHIKREMFSYGQGSLPAILLKGRILTSFASTAFLLPSITYSTQLLYAVSSNTW